MASIEDTLGIEWSTVVGYVSLVTTFMRLIKSNFGMRVAKNSIARAYINMLRGYMAVRRGDFAAENAFVRSLYLLKARCFDVPYDRDELLRDHDIFANWLMQPFVDELSASYNVSVV